MITCVHELPEELCSICKQKNEPRYDSDRAGCAAWDPAKQESVSASVPVDSKIVRVSGFLTKKNAELLLARCPELEVLEVGKTMKNQIKGRISALFEDRGVRVDIVDFRSNMVLEQGAAKTNSPDSPTLPDTSSVVEFQTIVSLDLDALPTRELVSLSQQVLATIAKRANS